MLKKKKKKKKKNKSFVNKFWKLEKNRNNKGKYYVYVEMYRKN